MRRVLVLSALAALASVALIATAGASPSAYFSVIAKTTNQHPVAGSNRFALRGELLEAGHRDHVRGHFRALFNRNGRTRAVAYFHNGKIKADGHGRTLRIIDGTRHWEGASGTLEVKELTKRTARLTFDVEPAPTKK